MNWYKTSKKEKPKSTYKMYWTPEPGQEELYEGEKSPLSDFGADITIERDSGKLKFDFHPPGWNFDTNDVGEAAAIIMSSHYKDDEKILSIKLSPLDKIIDIEMVLYWLSGGNAEWRFGDNYTISWDDAKEIFISEFSDDIKKIMSSSKTLGDIVREFENIRTQGTIYEVASEHGMLDREDDEEEKGESSKLDLEVPEDPRQMKF